MPGEGLALEQVPGRGGLAQRPVIGIVDGDKIHIAEPALPAIVARLRQRLPGDLQAPGAVAVPVEEGQGRIAPAGAAIERLPRQRARVAMPQEFVQGRCPGDLYPVLSVSDRAAPAY